MKSILFSAKIFACFLNSSCTTSFPLLPYPHDLEMLPAIKAFPSAATFFTSFTPAWFTSSEVYFDPLCSKVESLPPNVKPWRTSEPALKNSRWSWITAWYWKRGLSFHVLNVCFLFYLLQDVQQWPLDPTPQLLSSPSFPWWSQTHHHLWLPHLQVSQGGLSVTFLSQMLLWSWLWEVLQLMIISSYIVLDNRDSKLQFFSN